MQNTHETYIMDKEQESLQINNEHCSINVKHEWERKNKRRKKKMN